LYRPMPPSRCVPVDEALRFVGSNAVKLAKTRQPHGPSSTWRRSHVIVQALERCQDVVQTEFLRDTWHLAKIRMGFDGVLQDERTTRFSSVESLASFKTSAGEL
jgi:hypothetical protein